MALSQNERNKKWIENNREKANYLSTRSTTRNFIKKRATVEDLEELKELIRLKEIELDKTEEK